MAKREFDSSFRVENASEKEERLARSLCFYPDEKYLNCLLIEIKEDMIFDDSEMQILEITLSKMDRDYVYSKALFETGKLYMFYCVNMNEYERMELAFSKFDESASLGFEEAKMYSEIAHFIPEINTLIMEGKDYGRYRKLFDCIIFLSEDVKGDEEILCLKAYDMCAELIYAYYADFKREGADSKEIRDLILGYKTRVVGFPEGNEQTEEEKRRVLSKCERALKEIEKVEGSIK